MKSYIMAIVKIFKLCINLGYECHTFFQKIDNADMRRKARTIYLLKIRATIKELNEALEELQVSAQKVIDSSTNTVTEKEEKDLDSLIDFSDLQEFFYLLSLFPLWLYGQLQQQHLQRPLVLGIAE